MFYRILKFFKFDECYCPQCKSITWAFCPFDLNFVSCKKCGHLHFSGVVYVPDNTWKN